MKQTDLTDKLHSALTPERLQAVSELGRALKEGAIPQPEAGEDVNNHIHTIYSFSPYSPAEAVWRSFNAGLQTAGIMDHDTISGAGEFIEAGKRLGLDAEVARALSLQTFLGTAKLLAETGMEPQTLVDMVSSPKGTTVAGREILESSGYAEEIERTIRAATERSKELGR